MKYNTNPKEFNLKEWRQNNSVSTRGLAKITGMNYGHSYRIEKGFYVAKPETAVKIFNALQTYEIENKSEKQTNFLYLLKDLQGKK